ncbi:hypothetical protein C8R44DRAFT_981290 [Mycena epipterygia]|nr:hypothetical protein C8R44DRAFT_981290 [Mycena epipterygia]
MWIPEWLGAAVISSCCWPGRPEKYCGNGADGVERMRGGNYLGRIPPLVHTVQLTQPGDDEDLEEEDVPAPLTWRYPDDLSLWLILDERPILRGKVYNMYDAIYNKDEEDSDPAFTWIHSTWIDWKHVQLRAIEKCAASQKKNPKLPLIVGYIDITTGKHLTEEEWFSKQMRSRSPDILWSLEHNTGRQTVPSNSSLDRE